jgi:hypothetical protein
MLVRQNENFLGAILILSFHDQPATVHIPDESVHNHSERSPVGTASIRALGVGSEIHGRFQGRHH